MLKESQRIKITGGLYDVYRQYCLDNAKTPCHGADNDIVSAVIDRIKQAEIWIPDSEVYQYYSKRKNKMKTRYEKEQKTSIVDPDTDREEKP